MNFNQFKSYTLICRIVIFILAISLTLLLTSCAAIYDKYGGPYLGSPADAFKPGVLSERGRELIVQAFKGFEDQTMYDYHLHFFGSGRPQNSNYCPELNWLPAKNKPRVNFDYFVEHQIWWQRPFIKGIFLDTMDISDESQMDDQYMKRLVDMVAAYGSPHFADMPSKSPHQTTFLLLAMDGSYDEHGHLVPLPFYVSNQYIVELTKCLNSKLDSSGGFLNKFEAVGSINPLKLGSDGNSLVMRSDADWLSEIDYLARNGVRWIKWRPPTMRLDPQEVSTKFYKELKKRNIGILTHTGDSSGIVVSDEENRRAAPYKMEKAILNGVRVVMLHIGRAGNHYSEQFFNLLEEYPIQVEQHYGELFGELSAVPYGDSADLLHRVIKDGNKRIVNGSDYPATSPYIFISESLRVC